MNISIAKTSVLWPTVVVVMLYAISGHAANDYIVASNGGDITGADLSARLAQGDVKLQSSQGKNSGSGNVVISDIVTWNTNSTLTLNASNSVIINTDISASGATAGLVISPATANGTESATATGTYRLNGASVTLSGSAPTLNIAGILYAVINSLGAATDAVTPPTTPTLQGMAATANLVMNFALGSDIDATETSTWNSGAGFTPIGVHGSIPQNPPTTPFNGRFEGLGHIISKVTIQLPDRALGVGLFGATGSGAAVRSLRLADATVTGQSFTGGLAGENNGIIDQCSVKGVITGLHNTGGLVGYNTASGTVTNSYAEGSVSTTSGGIHVGGLAGSSLGVLRNSYATATVSGNGDKVGGLVGSNGSTYLPDTGTRLIDSCYATGLVSGSTNIGGLAGYNHGGTFNTSYWNTTTSGQSTSDGGTGLDTAQMQSQASFTGFDFSNTWIILEGMTSPLLWFENSTTIYTAFQLQLMATNLNANYTLGADIDAAATGTNKGVWGASGFVPVGSATTPFTGTLNGNGHAIRQLTINAQGSDNVGLFGYTGTASMVSKVGIHKSMVTGRNNVGSLAGNNNGTISNCYAEQSNVTGNGDGSSGSGGLVGTNSGTISSSHASGSVTGIDDVGGFVGVNRGQISASYALARVTNNTNQAGGLIGTNETGGMVSACYASGQVGDVGITGEMGGLVGLNSGNISYSNALGRTDCGSNSSCGGLVGNNNGTISDCYATGGVSGSGSNAGGLAGINNGTVSNAYATGSVAGKENSGGLAGNNKGTISNGYWNSSLSENGVGTGTAAGAVGLTAAQMLASSSFNNFVLTTTPGAQGWVVVNTNGSLQASTSSTPAAASPMLATEYSTAVNNAHQLQLMLMNLGASYSLGADIAAEGTGNAREVWGALGFVPVGNAVTPYSGTFDGQRHKISGLAINRWDDNVGLFGYTNNATIRNVGVEARISGANVVGGLVGYSADSSISNCYVNGYLYGYYTFANGKGDNIGGLVGYNGKGTINNCYTSGIAYGGRFVGGLTGYNIGEIKDSHTSTNVNARSPSGSAGGLVGNNSGPISSCYARGGLLAKQGAAKGGLIAVNIGSVNNSFWDVTTSGQPGSSGGTGLSDALMQQQSSFSGWDFTSVWQMQTYPALRNMPTGYTP
jgi:mucin-19